VLRRARHRQASPSATRVGIVAAQSIGEPGTQLTLRTFHTAVLPAWTSRRVYPCGGAVRGAQAQGLAKLAETDGTVGIERTDKAIKVTITTTPARSTTTRSRAHPLFVAEGEKVTAGVHSTRARSTRTSLLAIRGRTDAEVYFVQEVQKVYRSQGVDIKDKHIEIIVRQMRRRSAWTRRATRLPAGQLRRPPRDRARSTRAQEGKKEQARAEEIILGITKASLRDRLVPVGRLVPGDHQGPHGRRARGQDDRLLGPEGERDHRQADPGRHRPRRYRRSRSSRAEPIARPTPEEIGLLDESELAAELGLDRRWPRGARLRGRQRRHLLRRGARRLGATPPKEDDYGLFARAGASRFLDSP
jgi:hypothetical protein